MSREFRHGVGGAVDLPKRQEHEPTPAERAEAANTIARNLDGYQQQVTTGIAAMATAQADSDPIAWDRGRKQADNGIKSIAHAVEGALAAKDHAGARDVAAKLGGASDLLADMQARVDAAPSKPEKLAPTISCADDLLAVLPPDAPVSDTMRIYGEAERAVAAVFRGAMVWSDIQAFGDLLANFPAHPIARRFGRFGAERKQRLQAILKDSKVRARARAMEAARQQAAPLVAPPSGYRGPVTIDKPAEYEESRATIDIGPGAEDHERGAAKEAAPPAAQAHDAPNPDGAIERANGTAMDKPAEYEETRATIDVDGGRDASPDAARGDRDPAGAVARANGTAIDKPAEYEETRATLEVGAADSSDERRGVTSGTNAPPGSRGGSQTHPAASAPVAPGDAAGPAGGIATHRVIAAEPQIAALLASPIAPTDAAGLQRRKRELLATVAALPDEDRQSLARRIDAPAKDDAFAGLFHRELHDATVTAVINALRGGAVALPPPADAVEMSAFVASVTNDRFVMSPSKLSLDGAWKRSADASYVCLPGFGPPSGAAAVAIQWKLLDRFEEPVQAGTVSWAATLPVMAPITFQVKEAGRYVLVVDVVEGGIIRKRLDHFFQVESASGADVAGSMAIGERLNAANDLSNSEVESEAATIRERLAEFRTRPGVELQSDPEYVRLRATLDDLEWQAHTRRTDGVPLSTGRPGENEWAQAAAPGMAGTLASIAGMGASGGLVASALDGMRQPDADLAAINPSDRGAIRQEAERLVNRLGIAGAHAHVDTLRGAEMGTGAGAHAPDRYAVFDEEIDALAALYNELPARFEAFAGNLTEQVLAENQQKIESELERYGIREKKGHGYVPSAGYGGPSGTAQTNPQVAELAGLVSELRELSHLKKQVEAAQALRAGKRSDDVQVIRVEVSDFDGAPSEDEEARLALIYEARLAQALATYPTLHVFLEARRNSETVRLRESNDSGKDAEFAQHDNIVGTIGWELNQKLIDIATVREKLSKDKLSIWALPSIVELTKRQFRVAPGTVQDAVIRQQVEQAGDRGWTESLVTVLTMGLAVLLAIPTGGSSVAAAGGGLAIAAEITLIAGDLYLFGAASERHSTGMAASNTALDRAQSLLSEEPSSAEMVFALLSLPLAGVSAARLLQDAKSAVGSVRSLREAVGEAAGDLAHPSVEAQRRHVESWARKAFKNASDPDRAAREYVDRLMQTFGRKGPTVAIDLDRAAKVVDVGPDVVAKRLGVRELRPVEAANGPVGVLPRLEGNRLVADVQFTRSATVGDVLDHLPTVHAIERYNGIAGKLRLAWDRIIDLATGSQRVNPHLADPQSGAYRIFEEVRKHNGLLDARTGELADALADGDVAAVARIEERIAQFEGDLAYWQQQAADLEAGLGSGVQGGVIHARGPDAAVDPRQAEILEEFAERQAAHANEALDEAIEAGLYVEGVEDVVAARRAERAAEAPSPRVLAGQRSDAAKFIPPPGSEFNTWFDGLSTKELRQLLKDKNAKELIDAGIRHPGGQHEWLMVSRAAKIKGWDVPISTVKSAVTRTEAVIGRIVTEDGAEVVFRHGGAGSHGGTFHIQLGDMIDRSDSFGAFLNELNHWADRSLASTRSGRWPEAAPLGRYSLPNDLQLRGEGGFQ